MKSTHMHRVVVACSSKTCQTTEQRDRLLGLQHIQTKVQTSKLRDNRKATVEIVHIDVSLVESTRLESGV